MYMMYYYKLNMTTTVTVSEFRENLSKYIDLLWSGKNVVEVVDGRKGKVLAKVTKPKKKEFDWDSYMKFVESIRGKLFTAGDVKDIEKMRKVSRERFKKLNW